MGTRKSYLASGRQEEDGSGTESDGSGGFRSAISYSSEQVDGLTYGKFQAYAGYRSAKEAVDTFKRDTQRGFF